MDLDPRPFHRSLSGYAPTPLLDLPVAAARLGLGQVLVKDESQRFDLGAFKFLGASWAIHRAVEARPGFSGTLVTATDGNHGRAVARTARLLGLAARVFVPPVPPIVVARITAEGAELIHVDGAYDDAVAAAAAWVDGRADAVLVQDTAWEGYEQIPGWIVDGYETLFAEIDDDCPAPDVVLVPVGVGSLAQAAVVHYAGTSTRVISVEPDTAACIAVSLERGELTSVGTADTVMNGLNCGTPSALAWPILRDGLAGAVTVTDDECRAAMAKLAAEGVRSGPSGAAAFAALDGLAAAGTIGDHDVVVCLNTEGPLE